MSRPVSNLARSSPIVGVRRDDPLDPSTFSPPLPVPPTVRSPNTGLTPPPAQKSVAKSATNESTQFQRIMLPAEQLEVDTRVFVASCK
jgi:hypothetical protein